MPQGSAVCGHWPGALSPDHTYLPDIRNGRDGGYKRVHIKGTYAIREADSNVEGIKVQMLCIQRGGRYEPERRIHNQLSRYRQGQSQRPGRGPDQGVSSEVSTITHRRHQNPLWKAAQNIRHAVRNTDGINNNGVSER